MPQVVFNPFTASFDFVGGSGSGGTPASPDTSIQFNDGGSFGGDSSFTFDKTTNLVTLESLYSNGDWGTGATLPATLRSSGDKAIMFWNPKTGAFWAGEWDSGTLASSDVGSSSIALGYNNKASGYGSLTAGWSNSASENAAIAIGRNNIASGVESVAIGSGATASASYAVGIGRQVEAIGTASFACGVDGSAIGDYSFVANDGNEASGQASAAFGEFNLTGSFAQGSLIGGVDSTVDGTYSFVFGTNIYASANNTITLGTGAGSGASRLANATANSLMVGFGSVNPTLMVTGSNVKIGYPTNGKFAILDASSITTDKTFTFPNQSGTFVLNTFKTIAVSGQSDVVADSDTDTLTLAAGSNITITTNASTDTITIAASGGGSLSIGDTIGSATQGSVLFAGASGVLAQDNSNLFWDDSNNRLGLGTTSPGAALTIVSSASGDNLRLGQDTSNYYKIGRDSSSGYLRFEGTQVAARGYDFSSGGDMILSGSSGFVWESASSGSFKRDSGTGTVTMGLQNASGADFQVLIGNAGSKMKVKAASSQTANVQEWQDSGGSAMSAIAKNGAIKPASLADSAAENSTIYYSTDANKLVYKNSGGTVNNLY